MSMSHLNGTSKSESDQPIPFVLTDRGRELAAYEDLLDQLGYPTAPLNGDAWGDEF